MGNRTPEQERELKGFGQADELELGRGRQRFGDVPRSSARRKRW
jgi:hypothetical protein